MKVELHRIGAQKYIFFFKWISEWVNRRVRVDVMSDLILGLFLSPEVETKLDKEAIA